MSRLLPMSATVCLLAILSGVRSGPAQELSTLELELSSQGSQEGWTEVQEGVLQRNLGENQVQTMTIGKEGMRWAAQRLAERISSLEREHAAYSSDELASILASLKGELARRRKIVQSSELSLASAESSSGEIESATAELTAGCEPTVTRGASAGPQSTQVPGASASANISFQGPCPGNTYTYVYSRATSGSVMSVQSREDTKNNGTSLASALSVSASGSVDCYSEASAMAWIEDRTYEATDVNYSCTAGQLDSAPYGLPFPVPGTIKAANFDNGGEGVAYHEVTPDTGSSYRSTQVDLYEDMVIRLEAGDWMQYTVDVTNAGAYTLVAQVSSYEGSVQTGSFHLELNGVNVTGPMVVPSVELSGQWRSAIKAPVHFPAGRHKLRFVVDEDFFFLDSLRFVVARAPFGGTPRTLPGTIKAVDFDEGGEQISYHDDTAGCSGSCGYRMADVDRWEQWVYQTSTGEWMEYTVNVTTTGVYNLRFRVASEQGGGIFHLEVDGVNVTGPLTVPTTGSLGLFQTVTKTGVSLKAGRHILRLVMDNNVGTAGTGTFDTITVQP